MNRKGTDEQWRGDKKETIYSESHFIIIKTKSITLLNFLYLPEHQAESSNVMKYISPDAQWTRKM